MDFQAIEVLGIKVYCPNIYTVPVSVPYPTANTPWSRRIDEQSINKEIMVRIY